MVLRRAAEKFVQGLGWTAAAYLGYWLAILLEQVMAGAMAAALAGVSPEWRLDVFGVRSLPLGRGPGGGDFETLRRLQWSLSLAASLLFLQLTMRFTPHGENATPSSMAQVMRRISLLAAIWISAHRLPELVRMAQRGGGQMRALWRFLPDEAYQDLASTASFLLLGALFLWFGVRAARDLLPLVVGGSPGIVSRFFGSAGLLALVCLLTCASLLATLRFRFSEFNAGVWPLVAPVVAALGFLLLANLRSLPRDFSVALGARPAASVVGMAVVLAATLAGADRFRLWRSEAGFDRVRTENYEILFSAGRWPRAQAEQFAAQREARFAQFARRLPALDTAASPLRVVVYPDTQARMAAVRGFNVIQLDAGTARISAEETAAVFPAVVDARLVLTGRWGPAHSPVISGWTERWLIAEWHGRPLADWAARLARDEAAEGGLLSLVDLFAGAGARTLPPSEAEALGAAWLELAAAKWGVAAVEKIYKSAPENFSLSGVAALLATSPEALEADWSAWKKGLTPHIPVTAPGAHSPFGGAALFRGVSLKPTELPAATVDRELGRLKQLGADAVALTTHEHYRGGNQIQYHPNSGESDERIVRAIRSAHALGLRVLLKPHIYEGGEGFAGNICVDDPAARAVFMRSYARLILHYARLAQDERVALFSVGNELGCLTRHESDWRRLIVAARAVYSGPLTYAANWGEEFETLRFGDALDFLGVNHYYPLTGSAGEGLPQMLAHAETVSHSLERVHARWKRPILFTEVGYPSVTGGTLKPWAPPSRTPNPQEQAAAYEAVFRSFAGKPWMQGYFWWAWLDGDFSPAGKPAETVLRQWYAGDRRLPSAPSAAAR